MKKQTIILGDFNINIAADPQKVVIISLSSFEQIISGSTFEGCTHGSLLDHIYVKNCGILQGYYKHTIVIITQYTHVYKCTK